MGLIARFAHARVAASLVTWEHTIRSRNTVLIDRKSRPLPWSLGQRVTCLGLLALIPLPALAYIGPGAGISFFGSLIGVVVTVLVAIGAILLWPIRRMMKKRRAAKAGSSPESESS